MSQALTAGFLSLSSSRRTKPVQLSAEEFSTISPWTNLHFPCPDWIPRVPFTSKFTPSTGREEAFRPLWTELFCVILLCNLVSRQKEPPYFALACTWIYAFGWIHAQKQWSFQPFIHRYLHILTIHCYCSSNLDAFSFFTRLLIHLANW